MYMCIISLQLHIVWTPQALLIKHAKGSTHGDETLYACVLHHIHDNCMFPWQPGFFEQRKIALKITSSLLKLADGRLNLVRMHTTSFPWQPNIVWTTKSHRHFFKNYYHTWGLSMRIRLAILCVASRTGSTGRTAGLRLHLGWRWIDWIKFNVLALIKLG